MKILSAFIYITAISVSIFFSGSEIFCASLEEIAEKIHYMTERDALLSRNIANADTPNYKSHDLLQSPEEDDDCYIMVTEDGHLSDDEDLYRVVASDALEVKPNGNNVTLEAEMAKKRENSIKIEEMVDAYNQMNKMLFSAFSAVGK